jgi:plasmid stability protein
LFKLNLDVCEMALRRRAAAGGADMKAIHRSILAQALMTSAASLALMMMGAAGVRAEIVTVQGDDGAAGADGVNPGDNGMPGGNGESVAANAGSAQPITAPLNKATATGGSGGQGGNGGASNATASTAIVSGPAESDAYSYGGSGGAGGVGDDPFGNAGTGGTGGGATAQSSAMNSSAGLSRDS